jgi:hypothetical protein
MAMTPVAAGRQECPARPAMPPTTAKRHGCRLDLPPVRQKRAGAISAAKWSREQCLRRRCEPAAMFATSRLSSLPVNRRGSPSETLSAHSQVFRRRLAAVCHLFIAHFGALVEAAKTSLFHRRDVNEHVFTATVRLNKSEPFSRIEPLHCTCHHVRTPF